MPFRSKAQRRYLFAKHPQIAREFAAHTPKGSKLPEHVDNSAELPKETKSGVDAVLLNLVRATLFAKSAAGAGWIGPPLGRQAAAAAAPPQSLEQLKAQGPPLPGTLNTMMPGSPQAHGRVRQPPMAGPYQQAAATTIGNAASAATGVQPSNALKLPSMGSLMNSAARSGGTA